MTELLSEKYRCWPVRLSRTAFFLLSAAFLACSTDLPIVPEDLSETKFKYFDEHGDILKSIIDDSGDTLKFMDFAPTFIGRTDSLKIIIVYGDTVDLVLQLSVTDNFYFQVSRNDIRFSKNNKKDSLTVTYTPDTPGKKSLGYLRLQLSDWADSLRIRGVGLGSYLDLEMIFIPGRGFSMGLDSATAAGKVDTLDQWGVHDVTLSSFFIGRYEVTNLQYYEFWTEVKPFYTPEDSSDIGIWPDVALDKPNYPVVGVSWEDATAFCQWLSLRTGEHYTLPTEAQWEFVASGGQDREYPWSAAAGEEGGTGSDSTNPGPLANVKLGNDGYTFTAPVNSLPAGTSTAGVLNMAGNVWEWCHDWYDPDYYRAEEETWVDPQGGSDPEHMLFKVIRGGSWLEEIDQARCANRAALAPDVREVNIGFRVMRLP